MEQKKLFDKKASIFLKGLLVSIMFWGHMFSHPDRLWEGVTWISMGSINGVPVEEYFTRLFHVAVPLFFFISGYAFFINYKKDTTIKRLFLQIWKLLKKYWIVFAIFIPICFLVSAIRDFNLLEFGLNLVTLSSSYCGEWWFLSTYLEILLFYYLVFKLLCVVLKDKDHFETKISIAFLAISIFLCILGYGMNYLKLNKNAVVDEIYMFLIKQPLFVLGYLIATFDGFTKVRDLFSKHKVVRIISYIAGAIFLAVTPIFLLEKIPETFFYLVYLPIFVYLFSCLYLCIPHFLCVPFEELGKKSTFMWLVHSLLLYKLIQKIIFLPKISVFSWLFLVAISYAVAFMLTLIEKVFDFLIANVIKRIRKEPLEQTAGKTSSKGNLLLQLLYQLIVLGIPLFLSPYLTRKLGEEPLGIYSYYYTLASYFCIFIMLGIQTHGCRKIAICKTEEEERKTFYSLFIPHLILGTIIILMYLGVSFFIGSNDKLVYLLFTFVLVASLLDCTWYYYGKENFKSVIIKNIFIKLLEVITIVLFVKQPSDLWIYVLIMSISICLGQMILVPPIVCRYKPYIPKWRDIQPDVKPLLLLTISIIAVNVYTMLDKTLIGVFIDDNKASVGFYDYSEKFVKLPIVLLATIGTVLLPKVSLLIDEGKMEDVKAVLLKASVLLSCLSCGACFGLAAISELFAPIYFGEDFSICGKYMLYLSPLIVIIPFGSVVRNSFLIPSGRDNQYLISICSAAVINLVINLILIPIIGVFGAIIGTVIAELLACCMQLIFVKNVLPIGRYLLELIPFLILGTVMFFEIKLLNQFLNNSISTLVIDILVGFFSYSIIAILYLFITHRVYLKEIYSFLIGKIMRRKNNEDSSNSTNEIEQ